MYEFQDQNLLIFLLGRKNVEVKRHYELLIFCTSDHYLLYQNNHINTLVEVTLKMPGMTDSLYKVPMLYRMTHILQPLSKDSFIFWICL